MAVVMEYADGASYLGGKKYPLCLSTLPHQIMTVSGVYSADFSPNLNIQQSQEP